MPNKSLVIFRPFEGMEVKQEVDSLLYNATDVLKAYNAKNWADKRMENYLRTQSTKEYIELLYRQDHNTPKSVLTISEWNSKDTNLHIIISEDKPKVEWVISTKKGKFWGTWMNQHLLVDFMMWLSPEDKHRAITFILEGASLAVGRNRIKDGYKKMCLAIASSGNSNYRDEATMLNVLVSGSPGQWQRARYGEDKIELMDDLQKANATMIGLWLPMEQRKNALIKEFLS